MTEFDNQPSAACMADAGISVGASFRSGANVFSILELTDEEATLADLFSGERMTCTVTVLRDGISQGSVIPLSRSALTGASFGPRPGLSEEEQWITKIPSHLMSESAVKVMIEKSRWIKRLENAGVRSFRPDAHLRMSINDIEAKLREDCPFSAHTLYRAWLNLRRHGGEVRALLPRFDRRGGAGQTRLHPEVEDAIATALVNAADPKSGRIQPSAIWSAVNRTVIQINRMRSDEPLTTPSVPTITRRVRNAFSSYEIAVRKYGKAQADRSFRQAGARVRAGRPLDVVQYDDTDTCIFAVDQRSGLPWGRCWLTAGVDENTNSVMGMSMSEAPRSTSSALAAVMNGMFPKQQLLIEEAGCQGKWEPYGHHGIVLLDNASYNTSMALEASLLEFGCEVQFARPHHPQDKSDIEHFNARFKSEFVMNQPGWSGPKEKREMLDAGIKSAVMTIEQVRHRLTRWIVDDYSNKPMKTGKSPRELWRDAFKHHPPLLPKRCPSQELMGTLAKEITFRDSGGLLMMGLRYQSSELSNLQKRMGKKRGNVCIRYSTEQLEYLYVLNPYNKNYLKVPCIEDPRYVRNLTYYQQQLILKLCYQRKKSAPSIEDMVAGREALIRDTARLSTSTKMTERKRSVRLDQAGFCIDSYPTSIDIRDSEKEEVVSMTELERLTRDIESTEIHSEMILHFTGIEI